MTNIKLFISWIDNNIHCITDTDAEAWETLYGFYKDNEPHVEEDLFDLNDSFDQNCLRLYYSGNHPDILKILNDQQGENDDQN